jgi:hypothetical protein
MKSATITARCYESNGKKQYKFTKGNTFYTKKDLEYFDKITLIRTNTITPEDEALILEKWKHKEIGFVDGGDK